ncbi:ClpP/crotonase-like domain-containing protein, partial [Mycotypha africana]|uniref:ClpP/crotonase-like domain-containing protein n=1 Tax=Mycotypha africana TaxID=64632 RepID=UPI0023016464
QIHVLHRKASSARLFILNRPNKLNALNLSMIRNIGPQLKAWDVSTLAKVIILKGVGRGKFCTGDDLLDISKKAQAKNPNALHFFQDKAALVHMIANLKTPYITLLDGYALGGSLGLFAHGPFRIATENSLFAVPEVELGACLNAGSSFFLSRLDGELGTYLALTGHRLEGIDLFLCGIATHYISSSRLPALENKLIDLETIEHEIIQQVLEKFVERKEPSVISLSQDMKQMIERCFAFNTVEDIIYALEKERETPWIRETIQKLLAVSPTSSKVMLKVLRKAKGMPLNECLTMEFDLIQKFLVTSDFHIGIDSTFNNKAPKKPLWQPPHISDVSEDDIDRLYFTRSSPNELRLPSPMDIKQYPYWRFALPSGDDIKSVLDGVSPEFGLGQRLERTEEVIDWFVARHKNKWGVREKVTEFLSRRAVSID